MRTELEVGGRRRVVEIERRGGVLVVRLDGREIRVYAAPSSYGRWSLRLLDGGGQHEVVVVAGTDRSVLEVLTQGHRVPVRLKPGGRARSDHGGDGPDRVLAPMPGKVVRVLVQKGQSVEARQGVVVVEAMKMENELRAGRAGVVQEILVTEGASVDAGTPLVVLA